MAAAVAVDAGVRALLAGVAARDLGVIEPLLAEGVVWHGDGPGSGASR